MDEWNVDDDLEDEDAPCVCDECMDAWMGVLVAEVALADAIAAAFAEIEARFK